MNKKLKFAVVSGRFDNAAVGNTMHRDDVPNNVQGYYPVRFSTRKEADKRAEEKADQGAFQDYQVLVVRKSGRRGWVVVNALEGRVVD